MVVPTISSATVTSSSITTDQTTTISCSIADTPTVYVVKVNGKYFDLTYNGTNYTTNIRGSDVGAVSSGTVTIYALNASNESSTNTSLTLTVTNPTSPDPIEIRVCDRFIKLIRNDAESYEKFSFIQKIEKNMVYELLDDPKNLPFVYIHPISAIPEEDGGTNMRFRELNIEMLCIFDFDEKIEDTQFLQLRKSLTRMRQRNPHLKYGTDLFIVNSWKISNIKYPTADGFGTITLTVDCPLENVT